MLKRNTIPKLLILIACVTSFTAGLGASLWTKVEVVNILFYSIFLFVALSGLTWFGFEFLLGFRAYRQTTAKRFDRASEISTTRVQLPSLPKPELIDIDVETMDNVDTLFYQAEKS